MIDSYGANSDKTAWLGIDPGVTTGWALVGDHESILGSGNLDASEIESQLDTIIRIAHNDGYYIRVVIERMPRAGRAGGLARRLDEVLAGVSHIINDVYSLDPIYITPGEWKPSRVAKTTPLKRGQYSAHERDAIRMTLYAIDKNARTTHYAK